MQTFVQENQVTNLRTFKRARNRVPNLNKRSLESCQGIRSRKGVKGTLWFEEAYRKTPLRPKCQEVLGSKEATMLITQNQLGIFLEQQKAK